MKAALYLRVSTTDRGQSVEVQEGPLNQWLDRLGGYDARITYSEEGVSGARTSRPRLDELVRAVRRREVDAVAVWKLDRLGRSLEHLLQLLREFEANQVRLLVHDTAIDTGTSHGRLFFQMAGACLDCRADQRRHRLRENPRHQERSTHRAPSAQGGLGRTARCGNGDGRHAGRWADIHC